MQIGRVCLINFGHLANKLCTVIDIVDANRALVEGPEVPRQVIPIRRLSLTKIHIMIPHSCSRAVFKKEFEKENVMEKWNKTAWAAKLAVREKRANMNDFERFQVMLARKKVNSAVRRNLGAAIKKEKK